MQVCTNFDKCCGAGSLIYNQNCESLMIIITKQLSLWQISLITKEQDTVMFLVRQCTLCLTTAVAMMAAGWDGSTSDAPGFPKNGNTLP